jgi:hypothetical protein
MSISRDDLKLVTYLDLRALDARIPNLMPLWDGQRWHYWAETEKGLLELKIVEVSHVTYVAKQPANENDVIIPFVELMWQHASWPEICRMISGITEDFHNLGTSIEKLSHFFENRHAIDDVGQFAKTEFEYIFILSRSVFDLLQEAIAWIWRNATMLLDKDAEARRKQSSLPPTFSKMVLADGKVREPAELVEKYALPLAMAESYASVAPFFIKVRRLRDEIVHLGKDPNAIYVTERGFCVPTSAFGFEKEWFWRPEHRENENLVSLLPLLAHIVLGTLESCGNLMVAFARQIQLPPPLAPEHRLFVRGPHNEALIWLFDVANGWPPWWSDRPRWKHERIRRKAYFLWQNQTGASWWDPVSNWIEAENELASVKRRVRGRGRR